MTTRDRGRPGNAASLRTIATAAGVLLTSVALLACVAVIVLTTLMHRETVRVEAAANRVRSVESLRAALLELGRQSDLDDLGVQGGRRGTRRAAEQQMRARLEESHEHARGPTETRLIAEAEADIRRYIDARRDADARPAPLGEALLATTGPLERALHTLGELADHDLAVAAAAEKSAARWNGFGNLVGAAVGGMLLIGLVVTVLGLKRIVVAPLLRLSDDIDRFAIAGDEARRLPVTGLAEFQKLARAFNGMGERLAAHEAARGEFLAGVAHDLRNPLSALHTRVQLLEALGDRATEEELRKGVKLVGRHLTRINRMVGDLLDATQIEAGQLQLRRERCDVRSAALEAVQLYQATSQHSLDLSLPDSPVMVVCDAARIGQVLNNLLSNAIKYSPQGSAIVVSLSVERGDAVIAVRDHGIGIPAAELAHIFESFRRSGATREAVPGVGLGLAVVRKIVEAHGGRIEVESAIGVGSTFRVRLPMGVSEHDASQAPPPIGS